MECNKVLEDIEIDNPVVCEYIYPASIRLNHDPYSELPILIILLQIKMIDQSTNINSYRSAEAFGLT